MDLGGLIFGTGSIIAALLLSIAAVLGLGGFLHAERSMGRWIVPVFVPLAVLGLMLGTMLSGRVLTYASFDIESINSTTEGSGSTLLRLISFALVGLGGAKIFGYLLKQRLPIVPDSGSLLFQVFLAFFIANALLSSAFGSYPAFVHNNLYSVILFAAVYLSRREPLFLTIHFAKLALLALLVLSLIAAIIKPELAVQPNYKGWIPGLSIRLWGLGSNPNSIGPLALLLLLLEAMQPFTKTWLRVALYLSAGCVFFLAQSKTVWAAALVAFLVIAWYRHGKPARGGLSIVGVLVILALMIAVTFGLTLLDFDRIWQKLVFTQAGSDLTTLTGRSQIWAAAFDAWHTNILFGYGVTAWGAEHRLQIRMPFAFHAHNQLLQSLSVAGLFGLATLLAYLAILATGAMRAARRTGGVSMALFATLLFRCATEVPLAFGTILNGDFLTHLLLFAIVLRCDEASIKSEAFLLRHSQASS